MLLADVLTSDIEMTNNPESEQADKLLEERFFAAAQPEAITEVLLIISESLTVDDPEFREFVETVSVHMSSPEPVNVGNHYYLSGDEYLVSLDRHSAYVTFTMMPAPENYNQYFKAFSEIRKDTSLAETGEFQMYSFRSGRGSDSEIIVIRANGLTVDSHEYRQMTEDLYLELVGLGRNVIWRGMHYYQIYDDSLVSQDRQATLLFLSVNEDNIDRIIDVVEEARQNSEFDVYITGEATLNADFERLSSSDLQKGELMLGLPIAIFVLILVFGALAAAFIPLTLALVSIAIAIGLASLFGQAFDISVFLINMVFTMGLAVGIDYSLFIIARFREERAKGKDKYEAIARAGATASRAVFFSGMTVLLALIGLLLVPLTLFLSLGLGAILVVIVSIAASLTLLPALLSLLDNKINALRIPFIMRNQHGDNGHEGGFFWDRISRAVMRVPVLSIVVGVGLLLAAAFPLLDINVGHTGVSTIPDNYESKKGFMALQQDFSAGLVGEAQIVIDGPSEDLSVIEGIEKLTDAMASDGTFGPVTQMVNTAGDLIYLTTPLTGGDAQSEVVISAVKRLREEYIPDAFDGTPARGLVTGNTAQVIDYINTANNSVPVIFPFILFLSFLLLTLVFRSLVVPLKAIILNLISVGAAYGLLVLIFQKGVGNELFGFQQVDIIEAWVPVFLYAVLFGLSMDYHVFLLSRIRERFQKTGDNTGSVAHGIRSTGRIITGAALIMVAVFSGFASGELVMFQQMGFGLAVAILLDATIVRTVLVPASMKLLGRWNWYLPSFLNWLPQFRTEGEE